MASQRVGIDIPLVDLDLRKHEAFLRDAVERGYTDIWSSEVDGFDAFVPLTAAAHATSGVRLGTAIVPAYTRSPALMAMSVAAMAHIAPGRFSFGIGSSSRPIVEDWNDRRFVKPYQTVRDYIRFLRRALTGERVDEEYETFTIRGFRLTRPVDEVPPILLAALRPQMLRLASREADGAVVNWLAAPDVRRVREQLGPDKEIVARVFVCPSEDADGVRAMARRDIAAYFNVPTYASYQQWLGRGDELHEMWHLWAAGERDAALRAIPDTVVDELVIHGSIADCKRRIDDYIDAGVTTPLIAIKPYGLVDPVNAALDLAPGA